MRSLEGLNAEQRAAASHLEGPVLILAGAGSGKTRTLTHRTGYLVESGTCSPQEILVVTFTNKAAGELKSRLAGLMGQEDAQDIWAMTFHGLCVRILRQSGPHVGVPHNFTIVATDDQRKLLARAADALGLDWDGNQLRRARSLISKAKNKGYQRTQMAEARNPEVRQVARLWEAYEQQLEDVDGLDFDDLLIRAVQVLEHGQGRARWAGRFSYLMVDEHQDTNPIQAKLIRLLCGEHRNLCVVGDEKQSIYRFRSAEVKHILRFSEDWPGATVYHLQQNYRSQSRIVEAANALMVPARERTDNVLRAVLPSGPPVRLIDFPTHWDEARGVVQWVSSALSGGAGPEDIAICYRTNAQSRVLEEKLLEKGIPYRVVGGVEFNRRVEVQGLRAYLSLLVNPSDALALERVINWPKRGVGPKSVQGILEHAKTADVPCLQATEQAARSLTAVRLSKNAQTQLTAFLALLEEGRVRLGRQSLSEVMRFLLEESGIKEMLREESDGLDRLANLDQLLELSEMFSHLDGAQAAQDFLEHTALHEATTEAEQAENRVSLMTLHATKGLEFKYVALCGLEDDLFLMEEGQAEEEESRRLLYVGMTRAEHELLLTLARSRRVFGRQMQSQPLRFLDDLPADVKRQSVGDRPPRPAARTSSRMGPSSAGIPAPVAPVRKTVPEREPARVVVGQRVNHSSFGPGTVVEVAGNRAKVRFGSGIRQLDLRYATFT